MDNAYIMFVIGFILLSAGRHWGKPYKHKNDIDQPADF